MNNEMMYSMLVKSLKNMNDDELQKNLSKVKGLLNENDYQKLIDFIAKEREK